MPRQLDHAAARRIVQSCLEAGRRRSLMPLAVAVLDDRAALKAFEAEDGTAIGRPELAIGKANAALQMGIGTRDLAKRAEAMPQFFAAVGQTVRGGFIPNPGGVLIRDEIGRVVGAVGISGDIGGHDEAAATDGVSACGFKADTGEA